MITKAPMAMATVPTSMKIQPEMRRAFDDCDCVIKFLLSPDTKECSIPPRHEWTELAGALTMKETKMEMG